MVLRRLVVVLIGALAAAPLLAAAVDARPAKRLVGEGTSILNPDRGPAESSEAPVAASDGGEVEPASHWTCGPDGQLPEPVFGTIIHELDNAQGAIEAGAGESLPASLAAELADIIGCTESTFAPPPPFDPPTSGAPTSDTDDPTAVAAETEDVPALPLTGASTAGTTLAGGLLAAAALVVRRRWLLV